MIPATQAFQARFRHERPAEERPQRHVTYSTKTVVAWTDDGEPLVLDNDGKRLVAARVFSNFAGIIEGDRNIVGAIPGAGWRAYWPANGDEPPIVEPVLAWLVYSDGDLEPVGADPEGGIDWLKTDSKVQLIRPDQPTPDESGNVTGSPLERGEALQREGES